MLLGPVHRRPWQCCLLFASAASAAISASNNSTADSRFPGTQSLRNPDGDRAQIAQLLPLTPAAADRTIEGNLYNTNISTVAHISPNEIAYISCDLNDYAGFGAPQSVFEAAYGKTNILGVILYSTTTDYCSYQQNNSQDLMQQFPIFSMTDKHVSATLRGEIIHLPVSMKYFVQVQARADVNNNSNGSFQPSNPLGPSPSTAVAMIILYSITGIITALFLVIIITGAVRAHRHPERYGPRNVLGRPRQSRARGLGRAILDTIPIVKFGEKEPAKPTDTELGSATETRELDGFNTETGAQTSEAITGTQANENDATSKSVHMTETARDATKTSVEEHQEGIAPAQALAAGAASGSNHASQDDNLGCSICTEDFQKGQDLRVLPCDHKFHPECVDPWLLNVSGTCPLCRVDLHPVTSHDSTTSPSPDDLAPPLSPEAETSQRRRTAFRDILSLRYRPNASAEERIFALRRLREQRRNQSSDVDEGSANASVEEVDANARDRKNRRMSARLSEVFSGRTRRERQDESLGQQGDLTHMAAQHQSPHEDGPRPPEASGSSSSANGR